MASEAIYIDRDNVIDLSLGIKGVPQDLTSVTKIVVRCGSAEISNEVSTDWPIKWAGLGMTGKIQLKLGEYFSEASRGKLWIIVYDLDNPNGIVWGAVDAVVIINI